MANARLHMICGNCGSNDQFEHHISIEIDDDTGQDTHVIYIVCNNCHTLHDLEDNAKYKSK